MRAALVFLFAIICFASADVSLADIRDNLRAGRPKPTTTHCPVPNCDLTCNHGSYNVLTNPDTGCRYCNCLSTPSTTTYSAAPTTQAPVFCPIAGQTSEANCAPRTTCTTCAGTCANGGALYTDVCGQNFCVCNAQPTTSTTPAPTAPIPTGPSSGPCGSCAYTASNYPLCSSISGCFDFQVRFDTCGCAYCRCL